MAKLLKRQYCPVTLKAWLDTYTREDGTRVRLALEAKVDGVPQTLCDWTLTPDEIGLPIDLDNEARGRGPDFRLPDSMINELGRWLLQTCKWDEQLLWLHLAKPYGYLGLVPWEGLLSQRLKVPILRLPDFIVPPPLESRHTLDVVLCSSVLAKEDAFAVTDELSRMTSLILEAVRRQVRLHVFVDAYSTDVLRHQLHLRGIDERVRIYNPAEAKRYSVSGDGFPIVDPTGRIENPWLLWIRDSLQGCSIDVAHFLCHGYFTNNHGALATSLSPVDKPDRSNARSIGPSELTTFLTRVGAWAVGMSSPRNNLSEVGLRALADNIGQMRPGSVLHHDLKTDQRGSLADAYRFLFSSEPERPPILPSVFMYCQPYRVAGVAEQQEPIEELFAPEPLPEGSEISAFRASVEQDEKVPAWVAASQRFIEQAAMQLSRNERSNQARRFNISSQSLQVERDNLRQLQEVVARVAREMKSGDKE